MSKNEKDEVSQKEFVKFLSEELGIKIEEEEKIKIIGNQKPLTLLGKRYVKNDPWLIAGSITKACDICGTTVTLAPSSIKMMDEREQLGNKVKVVCLTCFVNQSKN